MDYQNYGAMIARYNEIDRVTFDGKETKDDMIQKLINVSREKKRIQTEDNAIIREYITKYEQAPELINEEAEKQLKGFLSALMQGGQCLDTPIAFCISKLLLRYYKKKNDLEKTIAMLEYCAVFDIIIKEHLDDYEGSVYTRMADEYLEEFDGLSDKAKSSLVNCWLLSVINRKDMTYGLKRYKEIKEPLEKISREAGKDFMAAQYVMCRENVLGFTLEACRRTELAKKRGLAPEPEFAIEPEKEAPLIQELTEALREVLEAENVRQLVGDRVVAGLYCAQAEYHLGRMTLEELLSRIEEYAKPCDDYNAIEKCSALFTANAYYLDYLYKCSRYEESYILDKTTEILKHVLEEAKSMEQYLGGYQTNYCVLMLVNSASGIIDFDSFKDTVLNATVYANKALYVHTMMVKEICFIFLDYILKHNPQYLDGVRGWSWEECRDHGDKLMELMEKCTLFHDIGKYFCLDYVSNSSRNLTDDEFEVIKDHTTNFSKIYQGKMSSEVECVHDCALLHHLWYNEQGGYPRTKHTANKPFVNIVSIADSLDAATDNIGRPYGQGKTFEQMIEEFDGMKDSRYSGYICGLLHVDEVKEKIERVLDERRKEIYCDVYLTLKQ